MINAGCWRADLGDTCIQIFHFGRYIVGYTVGNFVLRRRVSGTVKHDFRPYIRRYTTPNEKFEYCYPHSNVLFNYKHRKMLCFFTKCERDERRITTTLTNQTILTRQINKCLHFKMFSSGLILGGHECLCATSQKRHITRVILFTVNYC